MESVAAIVARLQQRGVQISLSNGQLDYIAGGSRLANFEVEGLGNREAELIRYLAAQRAALHPPLDTSNAPIIASYVQRMWWNWIDRSETLAVSLVENCEGDDPSVVGNALYELITAHNVLRTSFSEVSGALKVGLNHPQDFEIEFQTVTGGEIAVRYYISEFIGRRFTTDAPWLTRAKVIVKPGNGCVAVIVMNHIIADGTSVRILREQLLNRLAKRSYQSSIPSESLQYADFAHWQREWFEASSEPLLIYWNKWVEGRGNPLSPLSKRSLTWAVGAKVYHSFVIPKRHYMALQKTARELSTSLSVIFLTALAITIARWAGYSQFPIRCLYDQRILQKLSSTVGLMSGADAILANIDCSKSFRWNVRSIELEYAAATTVRMPTMYAFPPHIVGEHATERDLAQNVGIVMNYSEKIAGDEIASTFETWLPPITISKPQRWSHRVSAISLDLHNRGYEVAARFYLHNDIITAEEQDLLVKVFLQVLSETVSTP